jgi:hypothetical protein
MHDDDLMLLRLPLKIALWSLAVLFLLNAVTDHRCIVVSSCAVLLRLPLKIVQGLTTVLHCRFAEQLFGTYTLFVMVQKYQSLEGVIG